MTGRAAGFCAGYPLPGYANPRFGRGCGGGRGWRNMYYATGLPGWVRADYLADWGMLPVSPCRALSPEQEAEALRQQAKAMSDRLAAINERIAELEKKE